MNNQIMKPIAAGAVELGPIPFNLYARDEMGKMVLFCRSGFDITPKHKEKLGASGRSFFISNNDEESYYGYAFERLESIVQSPGIKISEKTQLVQGVGKLVVRRLLENPRSGKAIEHSGRFVRSYVDLIFAFPEGPKTLLILSDFNVHLYTHCLNVCTFCLLIGEQMHKRDSRKLWQLGMGGLLHDIGMTRIDLALATSSDILKEGDLEEVRQHPVLGHELAASHGLPEPVLVMIRGHHERADGEGYPDGLSGPDIHPFARVAAVAEVYDSLTSDRLDRKKIPHVEALAEIAKDIRGFDLQSFEALIKVVLRDRKLIEDFRNKHLQKVC